MSQSNPAASNYGFPNHQDGIQSGNITGGYGVASQGAGLHPGGISEASDYPGYREVFDPDHHPDYHQWRAEQIRDFDHDYRTWREERFHQFRDEFNRWWRGRSDSSSEPRTE